MGRWTVPPEVNGDRRFLLRRRDFTPAYLKTYEEGRLERKVEEALAHLGPSCRACPRLCKGVDRLANQFGVCKVGRHARVASAFPHFGEAAAVNYSQVAREAIRAMHRQVADLKADEEGLALRGLLVRHLVMPGRLGDTREIVGWLAGLSRDTSLNLMDQYYPAWKVTTNPRFAVINRRVSCPEMKQALDLARAARLWRLDQRWREVSPWTSFPVLAEE